MTVFRNGAADVPGWCELEQFDLVRLGAGGVEDALRRAPRERVLVTQGICQLAGEGFSQMLKAGQFYDLPGTCARWRLRGTTPDAAVVRFSGRWGSELGGCGTFSLENLPEGVTTLPGAVRGDPCPYSKRTRFDRHYHDCDEYWIILEGSVMAVLGDTPVRLDAGDCLAIGMGRHHDLAEVLAPMQAVFIETTLEGRKRTGHLWEHTHGPAVPQAGRF